MRIYRRPLIFISALLSFSLLIQCQDQRSRSIQQSAQHQGNLIEQMTTITPMTAVYLLESGQYDLLRQKLEIRDNNRPAIRRALTEAIVDDSLLLRYVNQADIREVPPKLFVNQSVPVHDMAYVNMFLNNIAKVPSVMTQAVHHYYQIGQVVNAAGKNVAKIQSYKKEHSKIQEKEIRALQTGEEQAWSLLREYQQMANELYPVVQSMVAQFTTEKRVSEDTFPYQNRAIPQVIIGPVRLFERSKLDTMSETDRFLLKKVGINEIKVEK